MLVHEINQNAIVVERNNHQDKKIYFDQTKAPTQMCNACLSPPTTKIEKYTKEN